MTESTVSKSTGFGVQETSDLTPNCDLINSEDINKFYKCFETLNPHL